MISWLDQFNGLLMQLEGYSQAVRDQQKTFSIDEFNRICDEVKAKWSQRPPPPLVP